MIFFSAIFGENETNSEDMDHKCRQSEHTVLYPNEREGRGRIGSAYADSFGIAVSPYRCGNSGPEGIPLSDVKTQSFGLSETNHYHNSTNTNIINCQGNIWHLHSGRGHKCPVFCSGLQEQQCDCSSTMKSCHGYFKEPTIRCLKAADINQYFVYPVSEKKISVSQQKRRTVPELYPPIVQERYPGQVLHFDGGGWEDDKQKAIEKGIVYKFLIQKKGLIYKDRKDRDIYRKVKQVSNNER